MLWDSLSTFDPKGTALLTSGQGTQTSTNALDLGGPAIGGANGRDLGIGPNENGLFLTVALNGITSSSTLTTLQIDLQGAPDNGSGAPGTWTTYVSTGAMTAAEFEATYGEQYAAPFVLPPRPPGVALPRFYQLKYTIAGTGSLTAGAVMAGLTIGRDDQVAYPSGFTPPPTVGAG